MITWIAWIAAALAADVVFTDASAELDGLRIVSIPVGGVGYSGVAVLDYDADGQLDLYFGNGPGQSNALLRNDGGGTFTDVAAEAGAAVGTGTGGVLAADLDSDGWPELVLAGDKSDLHTLGNLGGAYADVTAASGLTGARRNISGQAADIDLDGDLDVYVGASQMPEIAYVNTLWRNDGDRTFTEIAEQAGVATTNGVCAATFTHLDDDVAIDLLIANCGNRDVRPLPLEVYLNAGDGTFVDHSEASRLWDIGHFMGLAVADFTGDLRLDFFATNIGTVGYRTDPHVLWRGNGDGTFEEVAAEMGVAEHGFGWGAVAADVDNDGWEDLYYVGHSHAPDQAEVPGLLFLNEGGERFSEPSIPRDLSGMWTTGLATGDIDGNGWMDFAIVVTESPGSEHPGWPVLLLNHSDNGNHWLSVRANGTWDNRAGIGSLVYATAGGRSQVREIAAGASYKSTNSPWPHFGLGAATEAEICVRWPDGTEESFGTHPADRRIDVVQGEGTPEACPRPGGDPVVADPEVRCGCATGPSRARGVDRPALSLGGWALVGLVALGQRRRLHRMDEPSTT